MAINFPNSPVTNDTFTVGSQTFVFDGTKWIVDSFVGYTGSRGDTGFTGSQGPIAGSDGNIIYNNGGISGGATNLYYDDINDRVGIGSTTPEVLLHLRAASGDAVLLIEADPTDTNENDTPAILFRADGSLGFSALLKVVGGSNQDATDTLSNALLLGTSGARPLHFSTNGAVRATIDDSGFMGIGTNLPGSILDVNGTITAVDADFTGTTAVTMPNGTDGERPGTPAAGMLRFNTTSDEFEGYDGAAWGAIGGAVGGGSTVLSDLTDVTITSASTNDNLRYSGSAWVNEPERVENFTSVGTGTTINCALGNVFAATPSTSPTYTFSNPPASGTAYGFTLTVTPSATVTITWPASVDWPGGTAPDAPASGETDVFAFFTRDGGTTWYGFQSGNAMA